MTLSLTVVVVCSSINAAVLIRVLGDLRIVQSIKTIDRLLIKSFV